MYRLNLGIGVWTGCVYEMMYMYRVGVGEQTGCGCIECLCI